MEERPEALLKSALEKIVYFEARSEQLDADLNAARAEANKLRQDLAQASQREIELRRVVAELEVRASRAHAEREDSARVSETLRRERAELIGKMLEASRIHGVGSDQSAEAFDLAQFISELRGEVLERRAEAKQYAVERARQVEEQRVAALEIVNQVVTAPLPPELAEAKELTQQRKELTQLAAELRAQGRLEVSSDDVARLSGATKFPGRTEETLFGFSVRELNAPDASARIRAAERLKALAHPAAAPALATALHAETESNVLVALLDAFSLFARGEGVAVVKPHLSSPSPDVRMASLRAVLKLDATQAGPQLSAAVKDPDKAVRRRASLLALSLTGKAAFELGATAVRDTDAEVRALAALVLGASDAQSARPLLLQAMNDEDVRVRRAASKSLSKLLGKDVGEFVDLEAAQRRRIVRQLSALPSQPVNLARALENARAPAIAAKLAAAEQKASVAAKLAAVEQQVSGAAQAVHDSVPQVAPVAQAVQAPVAHVSPVAQGAQFAPVVHAPVAHASAQPLRAKSAVAVLEVEAAAPVFDAALGSRVVGELRTALRGRNLADLSSSVSASSDVVAATCRVLEAQGQVVRRGMKYFVA